MESGEKVPAELCHVHAGSVNAGFWKSLLILAFATSSHTFFDTVAPCPGVNGVEYPTVLVGKTNVSGIDGSRFAIPVGMSPFHWPMRPGMLKMVAIFPLALSVKSHPPPS